MTRDQMEKMVWEMLEAIDYDIAKSYDPETAEDPEYAKAAFEDLVDIVEDYVDGIVT